MICEYSRLGMHVMGIIGEEDKHSRPYPLSPMGAVGTPSFLNLPVGYKP